MESIRDMAKTDSNQVRQVREARGLSQVGLAEASRRTRQSIGAIEAGRAIPGVDALRIASALDCPVEALFGAASSGGGFVAEPAAEPATGRVALAYIAGRWVSWPLTGDGMRTSGSVFSCEVDFRPNFSGRLMVANRSGCAAPSTT